MTNKSVGTSSATPEAACIPISYSRLLARALNLAESELTPLIALTGLSTDEFVDERTRITASQQVQIVQNGFELTDDRTVGLQLGKLLTPTTHGALGYLVCSSPTLLAMLKAFKTYLPTRVDFCHLDLRRCSTYWEYSLTFDVEMSADVHRILSETLASVILQCVGHIIGGRADSAEVFFSHPEPDYSWRYAEYIPGSIKFSAQQLIMKMPIALCESPNLSASDEDYLAAQHQCQLVLNELPSKTDNWTQRVQKLMQSNTVPVNSEEAAAAMLYTSKRTLARKLKLEGSNFRKLRADVLSKQACAFLNDSDMSVDAIAEKLNYHDTSNFRRAFKSWMNMTPDQYRKLSAS